MCCINKCTTEFYSTAALLMLCIIFSPISATKVPLPAIGKCYIEEGVKYDGSQVHQFSANDSGACCTACHMYLGSEPCSAFSYNTMEAMCFLFSNVSSTEADSSYISGHSAMQLYKLVKKDKSPKDAMILFELLVETERHCAQRCMQHVQCRSFSWLQIESQKSCKLLTSVEKESDFEPMTGNMYYEIQYNFITSPMPKYDCLVSAWTAWTDCSSDPANCNILQCSCTQHRLRTITTQPAHGGNECPELSQTQHPSKTHILVIGGRSNDIYQNTIYGFVPETGTFTPLTTAQRTTASGQSTSGLWRNQVIVYGGWVPHNSIASFELFTGVPLAKTEPIPTNALNQLTAACAAVIDDKFYSCFGWKLTSSDDCDVVDLNTHTINTVSTTIPITVANSACAQHGDRLYVIGSGNNAVGNRFFQVDIAGGSIPLSVTELSSYPQSVTIASAVVFNNYLVVCGGVILNLDNTYSTLSLCYQYDLTNSNLNTNRWIQIASMNHARGHFKLVNWGVDKILAIGGNVYETSTSLSTVEVFENGKWTVMVDAVLPIPLDLFATVNLGLM